MENRDLGETIRSGYLDIRIPALSLNSADKDGAPAVSS
jgi:hypothetical protein